MCLSSNGPAYSPLDVSQRQTTDQTHVVCRGFDTFQRTVNDTLDARVLQGSAGSRSLSGNTGCNRVDIELVS